MIDDRAGDVQYMQQALELARGGLGWVSPNPLVGCVLVKDGEVVGRNAARGNSVYDISLFLARERERGSTRASTADSNATLGFAIPSTRIGSGSTRSE